MTGITSTGVNTRTSCSTSKSSYTHGSSVEQLALDQLNQNSHTAGGRGAADPLDEVVPALPKWKDSDGGGNATPKITYLALAFIALVALAGAGAAGYGTARGLLLASKNWSVLGKGFFWVPIVITTLIAGLAGGILAAAVPAGAIWYLED